MVGIEGSNCQNVFKALTFISDIFLGRYKDERSFITPYLGKVDPTSSIKISLGLTLNTEELDRISDFIISSDIPRIRSMNDETTSYLKIEIARKCLRNQISVLFTNPILEVTVRNPAFYQHDYIHIYLRIERDSNNFFVLADPRSGSMVITKSLDDAPKNFSRIYFADLLFDHFTNLHPNLNTDLIQSSIDCESPDIFDMLHKNENSQKYVGIDTVPSPSNAGTHFQDIPELTALSNYLIENSAKFTYVNVTFFDLIRTIFKKFITSIKLRSRLASNNWAKLLVERIDPDLRILESWLTGHAEGRSPRESAPSFEKGLALLLNLCGYRALHVGDKYEIAAEGGRHAAYGKTNVGIDVIAFSPDEREVLLLQCTTEWKDDKVTDIAAITLALRGRFSALEDCPELFSSVVTSVSRDTIPTSIRIPPQVKVVDINDLMTLLNDVKNGIIPSKSARNIFT